MSENPIIGFQVDPADIQYIGQDLQRPECILAEPDGTLWSADARGGVGRISPDGSQKIITQTFDEFFKVASDYANRFTEGTLPNGLAFDSYGNLWGTLVMVDQVFAITLEGDFHVILDDTNEEAAISLEKAFVEDRATPEDMLAAGGTIAPWFASVTFGGPDLKTAYIGSLRGTRIPYFQSPVAGLPMVHWE